MKTAIMPEEGKAVLLNCMDHRGKDQSFWELRLLSDMSTTHCRWIADSSIKEEEN